MLVNDEYRQDLGTCRRGLFRAKQIGSDSWQLGSGSRQLESGSRQLEHSSPADCQTDTVAFGAFGNDGLGHRQKKKKKPAAICRKLPYPSGRLLRPSCRLLDPSCWLPHHSFLHGDPVQW